MSMNGKLRVLYVSDRLQGGIKAHVRCLRATLPEDVEAHVIGEDEPFAGKSGHDWKEWRQIRRVVRVFRPDVIHFHTCPLLMVLWVSFSGIPCVVSLHVLLGIRPNLIDRLVIWLLSPRLFLPVSGAVWAYFRRWYPKARGQVFFNPLDILSLPQKRLSRNRRGLVVGMVGRAVAAKDWPSFHKVEAIVRRMRPDVEFWNLGEVSPCPNACVRIGQMDLFLMTSAFEGMPTTLLEAFGMRTAVCGFLPIGGMVELLSFSRGPVREAFLEERDCNKLAGLVVALLDSSERRTAIVEDGAYILAQHFDARKTVPEQLVPLYRSICSESRDQRRHDGSGFAILSRGRFSW